MTALLLSILILTGAVAPAFGLQPLDDSRPAADVVGDGTTQVSHAKGHPATLPSAEVTSLNETPENETVRNASLPENATTKRVTLLTGQTVTVVETGNRTEYRVSADVRMQKVSTGNSTYVFPVGVDFGKFDRHLFDVEFLVQQNLTDAETDSIPIIVSEDGQGDYIVAGDTQTTDGMLDSVTGVEKRATLESIDAEAGRVSKAAVGQAYADLKADDTIERVTLDIKYRTDLAATDDAVSASQARESYGVSGNNAKIAVLDTGIENSHPAIDGVVAEKDFTGEGDYDDDAGHGTHVAGIVASDNESYTGMAPNASLMDVRVLTDEGWGRTSWIIDGMEYADSNGADVISMSIGGPVSAERSNDRYTDAVNQVVANGTLVVVSAGNSGEYGYRTVSTPGIQSKALTVGATDAYDGGIASFSSRGPTPYGYYLKPDVVAPGVGVKSADNDGGSVRYSGTSMSAPTVSGIAALLIEKHPDWSPERLKSVLTSTADPLSGEDVYTQGAGEVNATDAVGTNVVVSPGTVDFGTFGNDTTATRTIRVTNLGESNVTLDATATAANIVREGTAPAQLNQSTVTVPANETVHLGLTVNTSVPYGIYSGRVSFDNGTYTTIFGFVRAHEVTVEKQSIGTTPVADDLSWLFSENPGQFDMVGRRGLDQFNGSKVTYHVVGGGEYNVLSHGVNERNGQPVVFSEELTVDGDEHVVLNESDTTKYNLDASAAESKHGDLSTRSTQVTYFEETSYNRYVGSLSGSGADTSTVRFGVEGEFDAAVEHLLVPTAATGASDNFSGEAIYHLAHQLGETTGTTFDVNQSALTEKNVTYYRNRRGGSYDVTLSATAEFPYDWHYDHLITDGIGDRRHQTIYLNDEVVNHGVGATSEESVTPSWNLSTSYTASLGDIPVRESVNEHPYTGLMDLLVSDGKLAYYVETQLDQGAHGFEDAGEETVRLALNGTTVSETNTTKRSVFNLTEFDLDPNTDVELTAVGRNDVTPLSTRTVTTYEATYNAYEDFSPPSVYSADVAGLTANNTADDTLRVRFSTHADATGLSALVANDASTVPFEDATGWTNASVRKVHESDYSTVYEATIDLNEPFGQYAGRIDLAVRVTDDDGNTVEMTTFDAVRVDAKKPTATVTTAGSGNAPTGLSKTIYTNDTVTFEFDADGTPGNATHVGSSLSADFTNFRTWKEATRTDAGTWRVTQNLTDLPDDGNYTLGAVAADRLWNVNLTETPVTVVLDRDAPDLGATVEQVGNEGEVTLTSDEPLRSDSVSATVQKPAGNTAEVTLTQNTSADGYVWNGTFSLGEDGTYKVTANASDRTGNLGTTNSTAEIRTVSTNGDKTVTVVLEKSGLFVRFTTNETGIDSTVSLTESRSALAPLSRNLAGLNFLNGELGKSLTDHLDNATIGIPVTDSTLPPGIDEKQVNISYYDSSSDTWEVRNTSVENKTVNGTTDTYWVTNVSHFSTYGAVVDDQKAPSLDAKSPDGQTFDWRTTHKRVTFNYSDDISGVNASAVELYFDGERVTDANATNVTGEYATYNATGLGGGQHTATVVAVDEAGNEKNYTTEFTIETDTTPPAVTSSRPADGATLDSNTESVELVVNLTDDVSGVNADAIWVEFDGVRVTGDATITSNQVRYTASSLSAGSSHTLDVHVEDAAGNGYVHSLGFDVAAKSSGGGGGGGANVPPPSVQVSVTDLTETYAKAKVTSARASSPGVVSFDGGLRAGDATVRKLKMVPKSADAEPRFFVEARTSGSVPSGVAAFEGASETLGYLTVTPTYISDGELDTVGVTLGVDAARVDSPKNVALYRYEDGEWSSVQTTFLREHDGQYRYRASSAATGTFAVGVEASSFEVVEATLGASSASASEEVTVSATVENVGSSERTYTAELTVDGEVVATKQVTLAAGERTTVEFVRAFDAGEHSVAVGSANAGTLDVASGTSEGALGDGQNQGTKEGGQSSGVPGFGLRATLVAFLVTALLARRRES
ncbi:S8 family serine peptidase [Halorussus aquaticus]|uniref:S8 family serine peptidase n=1 Tax=Halorussus aquaticus TaxID=2953748 RepID=A0ABD5Q512_9EURY|nr:S8 family serine peptidase [Halorussus aquaticus]